MSKFNFQKIQAVWPKVQRELPILIANQAQNYFLDSFKEQGWEGEGWKEVNRRIPGTKEYKYPSPPKASAHISPILVRTGKLRRAVGESIREATWDRVRLVVDLPYAARHNDGLDGMPKRHYMGDSAKLQLKQKELITNYIDKVWRT